MKVEYVVTVLEEDHPLREDFSYCVKRYNDDYYSGQGRYCKEAEDVYKYLLSEERKRNQ